jgi:hypothetical protein
MLKAQLATLGDTGEPVNPADGKTKLSLLQSRWPSNPLSVNHLIRITRSVRLECCHAQQGSNKLNRRRIARGLQFNQLFDMFSTLC